jgi:DNA-binding NarL/FixJ family response regulator
MTKTTAMSRVPTRPRSEQSSPLRRETRDIVVHSERSTVAELIAEVLAVESFGREWLVPVTVFDGSLPPTDSVARDVVGAKERHRAVIVVLCPTDRPQQARWIELGADAVFDDATAITELHEAVARAAQGERLMGVSVREGLLTELRAQRQARQERLVAFAQLTRREASVLQALARGKSPEDVARESYVSLNTIRTQIRGILAKLDVNSVVGAVGLAYRTEWILPDLAGTTRTDGL